MLGGPFKGGIRVAAIAWLLVEEETLSKREMKCSYRWRGSSLLPGVGPHLASHVPSQGCSASMGSGTRQLWGSVGSSCHRTHSLSCWTSSTVTTAQWGALYSSPVQHTGCVIHHLHKPSERGSWWLDYRKCTGINPKAQSRPGTAC